MGAINRVREAQALIRFIEYCRRFGAFTDAWHETWYYTEEQQRFFDQYETQLDEDLFGGLVLAKPDR